MIYFTVFSVVSVLVLTSASSLYLGLKEELPLYLTDDFLISKLDRTSRSVVTRNENVETPLNGATTAKPIDSHKVNLEATKQSSDKHKIEGEQKSEESGLVFLPSFGRRTRRAISTKQLEDLLNSESNIIFLPSFKRRTGFRRSRRDTHQNHNSAIMKRSANDEQKQGNPLGKLNDDKKNKNYYDDLEDSETGLVFLPSFGRKTRSLSKRDTSKTDDEAKENHDLNTTEKNEELQNSESEVREESGLVFIPSFGRRTRRHLSKRDASLNDNKEVTTEHPKIDKTEAESEDEEESGLVFIPSFGRRTRRDLLSQVKKNLFKREVDKKSELLQTNAEQNQNKKQNFESDMEESENGMVFLTSFGKRH